MKDLEMYTMEELELIESDIVRNKLNNLLVTFDYSGDIHCFEFINKLHNYLFCDTRSEQELTTRLNESDIKDIDETLIRNKKSCECHESDNVLDNLDYLWEMQIFPDGNTRTLLGYLRILNKVYNLGLDYDSKIDIKSGYISSRIDEGENKTL